MGASTSERDIVEIFPEKSNKIISSSIVLLCIIGIDLREGNYWAYSHLKWLYIYLSSPGVGETLAKEAGRNNILGAQLVQATVLIS